MTGSSGIGGAINAASWIRGHLIYKYGGPALGNPGSQFMIADHLDSSTCSASGNQSWLQAQGEMVNDWTDMYAADKAYCGSSCSTAPGYYSNLADELATTTISDQIFSNGAESSWPFEGQPGQAEPTVDQNGILSEPCIPAAGNMRPRGCDLGSYQPYLISKDIFERAIYCSNHYFNDPALKTFISANAASIASLPNFGFLRDSSGASDPVIFAAQTSVLDGLDADLGGSYAMC
jgi:hypothetical protein